MNVVNLKPTEVWPFGKITFWIGSLDVFLSFGCVLTSATSTKHRLFQLAIDDDLHKIKYFVMSCQTIDTINNIGNIALRLQVKIFRNEYSRARQPVKPVKEMFAINKIPQRNVSNDGSQFNSKNYISNFTRSYKNCEKFPSNGISRRITTKYCELQYYIKHYHK